jgi:hypothetical protein
MILATIWTSSVGEWLSRQVEWISEFFNTIYQAIQNIITKITEMLSLIGKAYITINQITQTMPVWLEIIVIESFLISIVYLFLGRN